MMRSTPLIVLLGLLAGCAHFRSSGIDPRQRGALWDEAHEALSTNQFARAEVIFERILQDFPETHEARESLFYLGALRLDPRNPEWNSERAQARLDEYLAFQEVPEGPRLYRYPEARTLQEIARQLNMPPDERIASLQPEERVIVQQERVVVPAQQSRALANEVERLRQQVAERDARIRQQQEELERIRRTLTGPPRS